MLPVQIDLEKDMINKLSIIKQILETDEETDKKILSILQIAKAKVDGQTIHIDQRADKRKEIWIDADLNTGKEKIYAETENLSLSGAFIRTTKKIEIGEDIAIKLFSPGGDEFDFIAEVMRLNEDGIGVKLKTPTKKTSDKFTRFFNQY